MRLQPRLGGAHQDAAALLAAHDLVRRGRLHTRPVAAGQLEAAALAAALPQHRGADPAAALADLVVEPDEVGGQVGGERAAAGPAITEERTEKLREGRSRLRRRLEQQRTAPPARRRE